MAEWVECGNKTCPGGKWVEASAPPPQTGPFWPGAARWIGRQPRPSTADPLSAGGSAGSARCVCGADHRNGSCGPRRRPRSRPCFSAWPPAAPGRSAIRMVGSGFASDADAWLKKALTGGARSWASTTTCTRRRLPRPDDASGRAGSRRTARRPRTAGLYESLVRVMYAEKGRHPFHVDLRGRADHRPDRPHHGTARGHQPEPPVAHLPRRTVAGRKNQGKPERDALQWRRSWFGIRTHDRGDRGKREPGANPGLPRSGEWERTPSVPRAASEDKH